jgi:tetratricopeptide (TPR) repeat protein
MTRFRTLLLAPLCFAAVVASAQRGGDLQAQIMYAFHAEDTNLLASLVQTLSTQELSNGVDGTLRYHLAHAEYRLGLLEVEKRSRGADAAFAGCIDQLKPVLEQDPGGVESLALQSACYANLARLRKLEAVLLRARAADRLESAARLAPRNPRVAFLRATDALARAKPGSDEDRKALAELEFAAQLFEQSSATSIDVPAWGHAEVFLELGRQLESRGDVLGARNWIEKSLIIAPDFKAAQRQLATVVRH